MSDRANFLTADYWREALGHLPVPIRDTDENQQKYVLMNGAIGNFCLDFVGDIDSNDRRCTAWSCDVGHYVTCINDSVTVTSWRSGTPEEKYSSRTVIEQIHRFHSHLEDTEPDRSRGIVAHVIQIFHRIRAVQSDGLVSLRILLHLMASAAEGQGTLINNAINDWGLTQEMMETPQLLSEATWKPLYNDLAGLGRYDVLRPDFRLLLRHASGALFQDAHLYASSPSNQWLPGFEMPVTVSRRAIPSETGIYFTPEALARTLTEEATRNLPGITDRPLCIFDPACGSGELLKECLRLLKLRRYTGRVRVLGWDKSRVAVDMARFVLALEKRSWPVDSVEITVSECDSLITQWPAQVDILVMNPPFKSWQLMDANEQSIVSGILGNSVRPNLAMAFAHNAIAAVTANGTLAMIVPNSLLDADSGSGTRQSLAEAFHPQLIARLGEQTVFSRALVDAGLYVGKRKPTDVTFLPAVLWADSRQDSLSHALRGLRQWRGSDEEPVYGDEGFSVYHRPSIGTTGEAWKARSYRAWYIYETLADSDNMIAVQDMFEIGQGIRLGNDVFIVTREYVRSLPKSEGRFFRPAVMNPSIVNGVLTDSYYAFYPYTPGLPSITSERDLKDRVPTYYNNCLVSAKEALKARKTLTSQPTLNWWDLLRARNWQREPGAKIVCKYFGGKRSFAFDKTGDFVVVVGNAWLLKKGVTGDTLASDGTEQDASLALTDKEVYLAARGESPEKLLAFKTH